MPFSRKRQWRESEKHVAAVCALALKVFYFDYIIDVQGMKLLQLVKRKN